MRVYLPPLCLAFPKLRYRTCVGFFPWNLVQVRSWLQEANKEFFETVLQIGVKGSRFFG